MVQDMILKLHRSEFIILCSIFCFIFFNSCDKSKNPLSDTTNGNYTYRIKNEFPHQQDAFTQGLVFRDGYLYESTGLYGQSSIRKVEIESGEILQAVQLPSQYFGEGMTIFSNRIYQLTWKAQTGFVYNLDDLSPIREFSYSGEGWGLTHDDVYLIMSDGTSTIRFMEPDEFSEVRRIEVKDKGTPVTRLNELEYIEGEILANVWLTNRIARISPHTGKVLGWLDMAGLLTSSDCPAQIDVLNGIAYDQNTQNVYITGKLWCKVFQIELYRE